VPYCMYLRKSRADIEAEARGEGETLARHEKVLLDLAAKMRISIPEEAIYREVVSGETIAARPVMQKLLAEIEQGVWDGVLVMEVERLARGDTIDQGIVAQTFKYSGAKIITPMKTYDPSNEFDEEYFEFGLFMSRREYKTINRRLQRGREISAREGKFVGNVPPYGYRRKKLERDKGYTLVPDADEAKIVKLIYDWFTSPSRIGVSSIRNRLNDMRVPTRKGGPWSDETVRSILTNPVYIGKIRWLGRPQVKRIVNGEVVRRRPRADEPIIVDGKHEAIIDENTYNRAQYLFAMNATAPVPSRREIQNPLAGIVTCGICGRKMIRRPYQSGYPDFLICVGPGCTNVSSHLQVVEEKLLQAMETWLDKYRLKLADNPVQEISPEADYFRQSIDRVASEIATLEKQLASLHDFLEQGVYSVEVFMERSKVLNERLAEARKQSQVLEEKLRQTEAQPVELTKFIPRVEQIIGLYRRLDASGQKNDLLKEVLEKAVYTKDQANRGKVDAFDLVIYPRLPR
jgi:site-specific DNA recombinase